MRCDPLHRLLLVSVLILGSCAFPLRLHGRRVSELMSGSSTASIRCVEAIDCAAAGYGIPANARYDCNAQGNCTFECNSNYTLFSESCWLNGTVPDTCNCDASRPSASPSATVPIPLPTSSPTNGDDSSDDVEVEETIYVTETSVSIVTRTSASPVGSPLITPPPLSKTSRPPKTVTVTELSVSVVPYIPPIISRTRTKTRTRTETEYLTVTSVSISTASFLPSSTKARSTKSASRASSKTKSPAPSSAPTGNSCAKTSNCKQAVPPNAHRICLKELCNWRCNKDYLKRGGKCVKKTAISSKPPLPPCGCVLPSVSTVTKTVQRTVTPSSIRSTKTTPSSTRSSELSIPSTSSTLPVPVWTSSEASSSVLPKTQARSTRKVTATVTSTLLSTTEIFPTLSSPTSVSETATVTIFTAASPTVLSPSQTVTVTKPVTISISPVRPLPTPRIVYIETCSCDEDCTINVPADATPICDPKVATCTWQCNPGFWINSDGSGCLPDGSAFAAFSRQLMVLHPTVTRPHTYSLYIPTETSTGRRPDSPGSKIEHSLFESHAATGNSVLAAAPPSTPDTSFTNISTFSNSTPFLLQHYSPNSFLDRFFFADEGDESNGFVNYVESEEATQLELATFTNSTVTLSMDRASNLSDFEARDSVRLASKELIQPGSLLVVDLAHVPTGCFVFPSIYLHGANVTLPFSSAGEIDILDGSSSRDYNRYSVRAPPACALSSSATVGSELRSRNCEQQDESGCSVRGETTSSGEAMNRDGGGVIALQLKDDQIAVWQWTRSQVPLDVSSGTPDRKAWGLPVAMWQATGCDLAESFRDLRLAFDITTCGAWRGREEPLASSDSSGTCSSNYPTCEAAVRDSNNFVDAFFEINSVKVYSI